MILVTGAAGFIGSALIWRLNKAGIDDIIAVDKFHHSDKWKNLRKRKFIDWIDKDNLFNWLDSNAGEVDTLVHLGACTDTTEEDVDFLIENNYEYSKSLWNVCTQNNIRFLYASSAATYGAGEHGYQDNHELIPSLKPLNPYGWSKQLFDRWVIRQKQKPPQWVGFKFFNVYGPNEYHKGDMASVVLHAFEQAKKDGKIKLFKSYKDKYNHGEQKRDFIYVKDVVDIIKFFLENKDSSGLYNVGTGEARTFNDLAQAVFNSLGDKIDIEYIEMPTHLRDRYQYFTEADITKLRKAGFEKVKEGNLYSLEEGIKDYIQNYLDSEDIYL